jgi:hypothetical protein
VIRLPSSSSRSRPATTPPGSSDRSPPVRLDGALGLTNYQQRNGGEGSRRHRERKRVSSPTATGDEEKRRIKEKKQIEEETDIQIQRPCKGQQNTPAAPTTRQAWKCLGLGLTLTEDPKPNPNQGTKIYRNLAHERLHRRKRRRKWTSRRCRWRTRLRQEARPQPSRTGATPNTEKEGRRRTEICEPAPAVEQRQLCHGRGKKASRE